MIGIVYGEDGTALFTVTIADAPEPTCTTSTAAYCTDFVNFGVDGSGSTITTSTSLSCSTITGCIDYLQDFTTSVITTMSVTGPSSSPLNTSTSSSSTSSVWTSVILPSATPSASQLLISLLTVPDAGSQSAAFFWDLFDTTEGNEPNFCSTPIVSMPDSGSDNDFPTSIENFNTNGFKGCSYGGTSTSVGILTCPQSFEVQCVKDTGSGACATCFNTNLCGQCNSFFSCDQIRCTIPFPAS
jgi:hypothetical protein